MSEPASIFETYCRGTRCSITPPKIMPMTTASHIALKYIHKCVLNGSSNGIKYDAPTRISSIDAVIINLFLYHLAFAKGVLQQEEQVADS
ncbi:MAG: hypothetical protein BWY26_00979 [Elusimicrobia bacterium ADurb.Bin231]|nr:MAG: hypothetical protein BWY26_00979 [Elusimicrobia bacterium ADurb.Bin231]